MRRLFPAAPHVAVFDTAFHHTAAGLRYLYGLPYDSTRSKGVRRYGFHVRRTITSACVPRSVLKRRPNELRLVSCHLGNGSSIWP